MSIVVQQTDRPAPDVIKKISHIPPGELGHYLEFGFLSPEIRPISPVKPFCGPVVTVRIPPTDSLMVYQALEYAQPGDVIVVDLQGDERHACWGEITSIVAKSRGVLAAIIDGPATDSAEIASLGFGVFARGLSVLTTKLQALGGDVNVPVTVGGVPVSPGDIALGCADGVLFIPQHAIAEVLEVGKVAETAEEARKERIKQGGSPLDICGGRDLVKRLNPAYLQRL